MIVRCNTFRILRDIREDEAEYQAVSIIEFEGSIDFAGQSQGHYICDVQEQSSKFWFRTNDNCYPIPILLEAVSKNAYVILLKRTDD
jgi:hypothetical protein